MWVCPDEREHVQAMGLDDVDLAIRKAVVSVAERLRSTPAVARSSYIDPRVLERYRRGRTAALSRGRVRGSDSALAELLT